MEPLELAGCGRQIESGGLGGAKAKTKPVWECNFEENATPSTLDEAATAASQWPPTDLDERDQLII